MEYVRSTINDDDSVFLFTLSNIPDKDHTTHFQSFVVDNKTGTLWIIDPAFRPTGEFGIYEPYIARDIEKSGIFQKLGYKIKWYHPAGSACQMADHDVFCQTWSLYVQAMSLSEGYLREDNRLEKLYIPTDPEIKYQVLLDFYKDNLSLICGDLLENYKETIKDSVRYKNERNAFFDVKPCEIVRSMTVDEIYPEEYREEEQDIFVRLPYIEDKKRKEFLSDEDFDIKRRRY